jgi:hypothetical protein
MLGGVLAYKGNLTGALGFLQSCGREGPTMADCTSESGRVLNQLGRCDELGDVGRRLVAADPSPLEHADALAALADIALETGHRGDAGQVAVAFLAREAAGTHPSMHDEDALFTDMTDPMLAAA